MMAAEALSRRQPHKATRAETEAQETRRALQWAADRLLQEKGEERPPLTKIIWRALQDAAEQFRRARDQHQTWLRSGERSVWPEIHRPSEENRQVEAQIQNEIEILRTRTPDPWHPKFDIEDPDIDRALAVFRWLRYVRGTRRVVELHREATIQLAEGKSVKQVRSVWYSRDRSITDRGIIMAKDKVLKNIEQAIWKDWI